MNRTLALAVCSHATNTEDARMLLDMLGVWPVAPPMSAVSLAMFQPRSSANPETKAKRIAEAHKPKVERVYDVQPCGTPAAYKRHLRAHEEPCPSCRAAANRDRRERKDKAR